MGPKSSANESVFLFAATSSKVIHIIKSAQVESKVFYSSSSSNKVTPAALSESIKSKDRCAFQLEIKKKIVIAAVVGHCTTVQQARHFKSAFDKLGAKEQADIITTLKTAFENRTYWILWFFVMLLE